MELSNEFPKRGDVYLVNLDPTIGTEMSKTRPALIISNDVGNKYSGRVIVAGITSKGVNKIFKMEVLLKKGEGNLTENSKIACDQIRAVDKKRLVKLIGRIEQVKFDEIDKAIKVSLDLK